MKKNILIILLILAAAGGWLYVKNRQTGSMAGVMQKDLYYCPMHPQYTSDRPGTCPICHMNLVKREKKETQAQGEAKEGSSTHATLMLSPHQQQLIGMKTIPVTKKMLTKTIRAYGYVAHDLELYEAQLEYIEAWQEFYAFVVRRPTKDEFRQDWWQYYAKEPSQARWRSDEKRKALERLVKAEYELLHMGLTDNHLSQLREIKYGQLWVQPELLFFKENHPVWVYAQVHESELGYIAITQKVIVKIPAYRETIEGVVRTIDLSIDPETRTTRVRIELPAYRGELHVNMYADIEFPVEFDTVLTVPRQAIMDTGLRKIVFVKKEEGAFEPRDIQTGLEGDGDVQVKSGLKEGDEIVVSGNFLIDSESRLQAALQGGASGGHQHGQ